jgi:hypothetical protein
MRFLNPTCATMQLKFLFVGSLLLTTACSAGYRSFVEDALSMASLEIKKLKCIDSQGFTVSFCTFQADAEKIDTFTSFFALRTELDGALPKKTSTVRWIENEEFSGYYFPEAYGCGTVSDLGREIPTNINKVEKDGTETPIFQWYFKSSVVVYSDGTEIDKQMKRYPKFHRLFFDRETGTGCIELRDFNLG